MPFVVYDKREGMYIARSTRFGFSYAMDINGAQVFTSKKGALESVGEPDKSYERLGKPVKLKLPTYMEIVEVTISEGGVETKNPYEVKEGNGPY